MERLWRALIGRPRRVDLGRLQAVRPAPKRGRRRTSGDAPYSAWDLRVVLAMIPVRVSGRRRLAAIAPVVFAAVAWFTIPSWAAGLTPAGAALGPSHRVADVLSSVACPPPAPVVGISGPSSILVGQTGTYTVTVQRQDNDASAPSVVVVTVPAGFGFASPPSGATVDTSTLTVSFGNTSPSQLQSLPVSISAPQTTSTQNTISVTNTATSAGDARCPTRSAVSQSAVRTDVVATGVAGTTTDGVSVAASETGLPGGNLHSPVTGLNTGILRTTTIGLCLIISGFVVVGGIRRNPHADAIMARRRGA
jgi:hypothetical protein